MIRAKKKFADVVIEKGSQCCEEAEVDVWVGKHRTFPQKAELWFQCHLLCFFINDLSATLTQNPNVTKWQGFVFIRVLFQVTLMWVIREVRDKWPVWSFRMEDFFIFRWIFKTYSMQLMAHLCCVICLPWRVKINTNLEIKCANTVLIS